MKVDVAVVGAGLAGLMAAKKLQEAGLRTVVLEARDRVGGRTWSFELPGGAVIDAGGQWIGPTQEYMTALVDELGIETFPTYADGESRVSVSGLTSVDASSVPAVLGELEEMAAEIPVDAPWLAEHAREWDSQTLQSWLDQRIHDAPSRALLRILFTAIFTSEADELSLLHVVAYVRSAGSLTYLTGAAQDQRIVGGAQTVSSRLAETLEPGTVRCSAPVRRIQQSAEGVVVEADGLTVEAQRVIVAVPVTIADRIAFEPPLPATRAQLHQRVAPGATVKLHFVYDTPFWREEGSNGRSLSDEGPVSVTFDNSPPSGTPGVLVAFVEGDEARRFTRMPEEARRKAALDCIVRQFGAKAAEPLHWVESDWSSEEWTRGCYGSNLPPGAWTRYGEVLREPCGLVHWAGAETSTVWMNYMEGAVRSGERAAAEVVAARP